MWWFSKGLLWVQKYLLGAKSVFELTSVSQHWSEIRIFSMECSEILLRFLCSLWLLNLQPIFFMCWVLRISSNHELCLPLILLCWWVLLSTKGRSDVPDIWCILALTVVHSQHQGVCEVSPCWAGISELLIGEWLVTAGQNSVFSSWSLLPNKCSSK